MHISFLIHNAYGIGGTIRTTCNLAHELGKRHEVEIVSVFRHRDSPTIDPGPNVTMRHLVDTRKGSPGYEGDASEHARPATVFPRSEGRYKQYSRLTDQRIEAHLRGLGADVVVGTRPGLNAAIARQAKRGVVRVGQEHLTLNTHPRKLKRVLRRLYPRLDAVTTVTEADARAYRALRLPGVRVEAVPNSVPAADLPPADGSHKWVVAAGRLAAVKRYDLLVKAFAKVVAERPDWRLRIYGGGTERARLREVINRLGLYNHVYLMGPASPLDPEWAKGSIAAVTSSLESFGMTIVEAMRCGLPVVATDCPHGPGEIIDDGVDGRLVPSGDEAAIADALLELINDDALRRRMGQDALVNSARYDPDTVAAQVESLFTDLVSRGGLRGGFHRTRGALLSSAYATKDAGFSALRKVRPA